MLVVYHWNAWGVIVKKNDVFLDLQRRIIDGDILPGSWIAERELVSEYGLSRTPIREVLNRLVMLGLLTVIQNRGYQVKQFTFKDVVEIFNARRAVESANARYACFSEDPLYHQKIEELRKKLFDLDIKRDGGERAIAIGNEVHNLLMEFAGNRYLKEFNSKLSSLMMLTRNLTKDRTAIEEQSRLDHIKILDTLEKRDSDLCESLMDQHLAETCCSLADTYINSLTFQYEGTEQKGCMP